MDGYCPICGAERDTAWGELALHTGRTIYMCGTSSDPEGVRQSTVGLMCGKIVVR